MQGAIEKQKDNDIEKMSHLYGSALGPCGLVRALGFNLR